MVENLLAICAEDGGSADIKTPRVNFPIVEFWLSPVENLLLTINLLVAASAREGLDRWVYTTCGALSPELKANLEFICAFQQIASSFHVWLVERPTDDPLHREIPAFIDRLNAFSEDDFQRFFQTGLEAQLRMIMKERGEVSPSVPTDIDTITDLLGSIIAIGDVLNLAVAVIRDPVDLRSRFISGVINFWERYYRPEFEQTLPILERSIAYHRQQNYTGEFAKIFAVVAGRALPGDFQDAVNLERVIFVPSCHVGPFLLSYTLEAFQSTVIFLYNARLTGMRRA